MKRKTILTPPDQVIVSADFQPVPDVLEHWETTSSISLESRVRARVLRLADELGGTGVYLQVGSALRICGYSLIRDIKSRGLRVCADLKLYNTPENLADEAAFLDGFKPDIVTAMCCCGVDGFTVLKNGLPDTEILGVLSPGKTKGAGTAYSAKLHGLILSLDEIRIVPPLVKEYMLLNVHSVVSIGCCGDQEGDNAFTSTAVKAGADRVVIDSSGIPDDELRKRIKLARAETSVFRR